MADFGYKLSGFPTQTKFAEAEAYLDKRLKGFLKLSPTFEADGSKTLVYTRTSEENKDEQETVTLVKNVTECAVMVFSDIPLKEFSVGGWALFARDIIPWLIFSLGYSLIYEFLLRHLGDMHLNLSSLWVLFGTAAVLINLVSNIWLRKNRSIPRIVFIQSGNFMTIFIYLRGLYRLVHYWSPSSVWISIITTYAGGAALGAIITAMIYGRFYRER